VATAPDCLLSSSNKIMSKNYLQTGPNPGLFLRTANDLQSLLRRGRSTVRMFLLMRVMYNKIYQKALTCGV
jgi:hypothetical protein